MPYPERPGRRFSLYCADNQSAVADGRPVGDASPTGATKRFPTDVEASTLCREFPSTPRAVGSARHALDGVHPKLGDAVHMTAVLLISELVTNSVQHSQASNGVIELLVDITPHVVRVEVSDDGKGFAASPLVHDDSESGRGLHLVQELADRWGRLPGLRTSVWFELDRGVARAQDADAAMPPAMVPRLKLAL
ncbi:MAG: ATP-binding protein [Gaiellaceae bacterium]